MRIFEIFKKKVKPRGLVALGVLLYILFALVNLITSSWVPIVKHEIFADFGYNDINSPNAEDMYIGPGMYIKQLGTPKEGQDLILFWEGPEDQARIYSFASEGFCTVEGDERVCFEGIYTPNNISSMILQLISSAGMFDTYGKSCIGVYNIEANGTSDPRLLWKQDQENYAGWDIKKVLPIPDIDGDNIPDIFLSKALVVDQLPSEELSGNESLSDYFKKFPDQLGYYFDIKYLDLHEDGEKTVIDRISITPKYQKYSHILVSGATGLSIKDKQNRIIELGNQNYSVIDAVLLNNDLNISNSPAWNFTDSEPELLLHQATIDYSLYRNEKFYFSYMDNYQRMNFTTWDDKIEGYYLDTGKKAGEKAWELNSSNMGNFSINYKLGVDYINPGGDGGVNGLNTLPLNYGFFDINEYNQEIKTSVNIPLNSTGFYRIKPAGKAFLIEHYANKYFTDKWINSYVFDSQCNLLWKTKGSLIVGSKDFDGDGIFNFGKYVLKLNSGEFYSNDQFSLNSSTFESAKFYLMNESTGEINAAYEFDIHSNDSIFSNDYYYQDTSEYVGKVAPMGIGFTTDDMDGDNIPEIIGWVSNYEYIEEINEHDWWSLYNFRLTLTPSEGFLNLSAEYFGYNGNENDFRIWISASAIGLSPFNQLDKITNIGFDMDGDGLDDYIIGQGSFIDWGNFILPSSLKTISRNFILTEATLTIQNAFFEDRQPSYSSDTSGNEVSVFGYDWETKQDWRTIDQIYILQIDILGGDRLPMVYAVNNKLYAFNDISTRTEPESFTSFFSAFSESLSIGAAILAFICAIIFLKSFEKVDKDVEAAKPTKIKKKKKQMTDQEKELQNRIKVRRRNLKILKLISNISVIVIMGSVLGIFIYLNSVARFKVQFSQTYVGPQMSIISLIVVYPLIIPLLFILPLLYKKAAPYFAEKTYFKLQNGYYRKKVAKGKLDYRIIVTQMDVKYDVSITTYIKRSILPVFIAFTIGISIYKGLADGGWLYSGLHTFGILNAPLTKPESLGVVQADVPFDSIWTEMGNFAMYCILPIMITYFITAAIIPSAWILDDTGITYYVKYNKYRGINDVESVSTWLLGIISGFFGMSAILSFIGLFNSFLGNTDSLSQAVVNNMSYWQENNNSDWTFVQASGTLGVLIMTLTLVVFPLIMSIALMIACIHRVEADFYDISKSLFTRMEKMGIDTTPVEIAAVLDANAGERIWTQGQKDVITGEQMMKLKKKKDKVTDEEQSEELENIKTTLSIIPMLVKEMSLFEASNIIKAKVLEADLYQLKELEEELIDLSVKMSLFENIYNTFKKEKKLSLNEVSSILGIEMTEIKQRISPSSQSLEYVEIKGDQLVVLMDNIEKEQEQKYMHSVIFERSVSEVLSYLFEGIINEIPLFKQ